jgi:hypothetical protein
LARAYLAGGEVRPPRAHATDERVIHGAKYGHVRVDKRRMKRKGVRRRYHCDCNCGREAYMSAPEILKRERLHAGCMAIGCDVGPLDIRIWHDPEFALWVQWSELLAREVGEVANGWGGTLYEGLPSAEGEAGFEAFAACLRPQIEGRRWWVHRITPAAPFTDNNVRLEDRPSRDVFPMSRLHVRYGTAPLRIDKLADLFGVSEARVTELRAKTADGEELVRRLIDETMDRQ